MPNLVHGNSLQSLVSLWHAGQIERQNAHIGVKDFAGSITRDNAVPTFVYGHSDLARINERTDQVGALTAS
jgi:hypothetical protein